MTQETKYIETHIGEFLQDEFLTPLNLTPNALAIAIKVPATRIYEIIKGRRGVTIDTDLRLCKYFGVRDGYFLRIQETLERPDVERAISQELESIIPYKDVA